MRIGLLADAHGNIYAFEKIWEALLAQNCDAHVFLGDVCGYYYYQNEIIEILRRDTRMVAIAGNHDHLFLQALDNPALLKARDAYRELGKSFDLFHDRITPENLDFLKNLPSQHIWAEESILAVHASPLDAKEYVYPDSPLEKFVRLPYRYVVLGHTHYAMDREAHGIRFINPGSCGQPRDSHEPSFAVLDTKTQVVDMMRVDYERWRILEDIRGFDDPNPYLIEVLDRKRR